MDKKISHKLVGATQAEREANVQARLARFKTLSAAEQAEAVADGLNYTLQGGLGGIVHSAKVYAADESRPAEARAKYAEAEEWGRAALRASKNPWTQDVQTAYAVKAGTLVSEANRMVAVGWVGDVEETQ